MVAIAVIGLLFISELRLFLTVSTTDRLWVDSPAPSVHEC